MQQIARQRDMFRKLLQDAAAVSSRGTGGAADLQLIASADAQIAGNSALQVQAGLEQAYSAKEILPLLTPTRKSCGCIWRRSDKLTAFYCVSSIVQLCATRAWARQGCIL